MRRAGESLTVAWAQWIGCYGWCAALSDKPQQELNHTRTWMRRAGGEVASYCRTRVQTSC